MFFLFGELYLNQLILFSCVLLFKRDFNLLLQVHELGILLNVFISTSFSFNNLILRSSYNE